MTIKVHQVTGVGPVGPDGSVQVFTVMPLPLTFSADWLATQWKVPEVGDDIVEQDGVFTLAINDEEETAIDVKTAADAKTAQDAADAVAAQAAQAQADAAQKKTDSGASPSGSEPSIAGSPPSQAPLPYYVAKPETVRAGKIMAIDGTTLTLENGETKPFVPFPEGTPPLQTGDFWVTDGSYTWVMPAGMFDSKFQPA